MKKFKVTLGLGRMANHHPREYEIDAENEKLAVSLAKSKYYPDVEAEIGKEARIWGKMLTVDNVEEI
jgi:hypothetical protein